MAREIKFRAWDGEQMRYPNMIDGMDGRFGTHTCYNVDKLMPEFFTTSAEHLMQFTGLHDKNGKEIYEGDLVTGWLPDTDHIENFRVMQVMYHGNGFDLYRTEYPNPNNKDLYFGDLEVCALNESIEIIGNIFENPDLLTPSPNPKGTI